ncbi:MAG: hypothetical protein JXI33_01960 [Candidatus Aminicenantes bacterium]|nr:hypothetical protein [Candidatus Aminicenantes bacterium]
MLSTITNILTPIAGLLLIICFFGGLKGLITGKLELLGETAKARSVRLGSSILVGVCVLVSVIMIKLPKPKGADYEVLIPFSIILFFIAGGLISRHIVKKIESKPASTFHSRETSQHIRRGDVTCSQCGQSYYTSLSLSAVGEVRVIQCAVCPANHVYAVCERCSNIETVQKNACPNCKAQHQWKLKHMLPV